MEDWSRWIVKQVGPKTVERYACSLDQLAPWLDGKDQIEVDAKLIATIIAERGEQVSNATLKRDLGALSSVLNYCIDRGWRDDNPVLPRLRRIKERRDPIVLPQIEHINLAISRAPGMVGHLIRAAMVTGCRQSELRLSLRSHYDDTRRQLTVIGKRNKLRVIDLAPYDGFAVFDALPAFFEMRDRFLFWHDNGQPYGDNFKSNFKKFTKRIATWAKKSGVEFRPFAFHHLRHWHAVQFLKDGYGTIYDLKERLGHTSLGVTEGYLDYLTADEQKRAKYGIGLERGTAKSIAKPRSVAIPGHKKAPVSSA
jgi:integrase/recombinase XerD